MTDALQFMTSQSIIKIINPKISEKPDFFFNFPLGDSSLYSLHH